MRAGGGVDTTNTPPGWPGARPPHLLVVLVPVPREDSAVPLVGVERSLSPLEVEQLDLDRRVDRILQKETGKIRVYVK